MTVEDLNSDSYPESPTSNANDDNTLDEEESLTERTRLLSAFFQTEPDAPEYLDRLISQHLNVIDQTTGGLLSQSLTIYAGQDNALFLLELIVKSVDDPELLSKLKKLDASAWRIVRTLSALYGNATKAAFINPEENPNSWKSITPKISHEVISEKWLISFLIEKYSGEKMVYEEDPSTLLQLITSLLKMLAYIPYEEAPDTIDADELSEFRQTCDSFFDLFAPGGNSTVKVSGCK